MTGFFLDSWRNRHRAAGLLLGCAFASGSWANPETLPLAIDSPPSGHVLVSPVPWVEVKGRVGTHGRHYLAIAIDFSASTYQPTGFDIDGDGRTSAARIRHGHRYEGLRQHTSAIEGDSILAAEMSAVRGLLEGLAEEDTQVAVVQFAKRTRVAAELSNPARVLEDLKGMRLVKWPNFTNLQAGLERSLTLLESGAEYNPTIDRRSILVVTDGWPSRPADPDEARPVADLLAKAGARVHILVVQKEGGAEPWESVGEIASRTGGGVHVLRDPRDLPVLIQRPELAGVESLVIRNTTNGSAARGVRLYPNGDWDAFVMLSAGINVLHIEARAGGTTAVLTRDVEYRSGEVQNVSSSSAAANAQLTPSAEIANPGEAILERLRLRTAETELFRQAQRLKVGSTNRKEVKIEAQD